MEQQKFEDVCYKAGEVISKATYEAEQILDDIKHTVTQEQRETIYSMLNNLGRIQDILEKDF